METKRHLELHKLHSDLKEASLEKACKMANLLIDIDLESDTALHLSYMLEYLRLNFNLVPKK